MTRKFFWPVLLLTALLSLVIRVEVGLRTLISFDEWQHVFMASSARWADLAFELRTNAHPPLFFLLLRYIVKLGDVALYRSISIAAGVGSIVVVGLIARKLLDSPAMQLACAAAFALSADAISISCEIRSYQLMELFVLLALWAWLAILETPGGRSSNWWCFTFAVSMSLALVTHYSAVFFLGAGVIATFLFVRKSPLRIAAALALPCSVFAVEYLLHAGAQPMQGYLFDYYLGGKPDEPVGSFILRNSRNFSNLFSPIELHGATVFLLVILLLGAAVVWVFLKPVSASRKATITFAIAIVIELLAASLVNKYPFGGMLRHQYIAGPFLLIAAFVVLDALIPPGNPFLRYAIPVALLAASIANIVVEGPKLVYYPGVVLLQPEFNTWRSNFPDTHAVYVDHWGVIGYFIHTSDQPRTFVRHIADDAEIDEYRAGGTRIFYDKTRIVLDLSDPSLYRSLRACLRESGIKELTLFFFSPGDRPLGAPGKIEHTVIQRAAEQGLTTTRVVAGSTSLFAGFTLR